MAKPALSAALAVLVAGVAAAPAAAPPITMTMDSQRNVNGILVLTFSGTVPSAKAGQIIYIENRSCAPGSFYRVLGTTHTAAGGSWRAATDGAKGALFWSWKWDVGHFRARWRGSYTTPIMFRWPLVSAGITPAQRGRVFSVQINTWDTRQNLAGKLIDLQRKTAQGDWVRVRRVKFARGVRPYDYVARFRVATRGLTLRLLVPEPTARPCYRAGVSGEFTS
jgi:hypothetical protein